MAKLKKISDSRIDETIQVLEDVLLENNANKKLFKFISDLRDSFIECNVDVKRATVVHFLSGEEKKQFIKEIIDILTFLKFIRNSKYFIYTSTNTTLDNIIGRILIKSSDLDIFLKHTDKFIFKKTTGLSLYAPYDQRIKYRIYLK